MSADDILARIDGALGNDEHAVEIDLEVSGDAMRSRPALEHDEAFDPAEHELDRLVLMPPAPARGNLPGFLGFVSGGSVSISFVPQLERGFRALAGWVELERVARRIFASQYLTSVAWRERDEAMEALGRHVAGIYEDLGLPLPAAAAEVRDAS